MATTEISAADAVSSTPTVSDAVASAASEAASRATFDAVVPTIALLSVVAVVALAGFVLLRLPKAEDLEVQKLRFAATTFTGLLLVYVFAAVLYYVDIRTPNTAGKEIFDKTMTAMTPLIGAIVGYLFGKQDKTPAAGQKKLDGESRQPDQKT